MKRTGPNSTESYRGGSSGGGIRPDIYTTATSTATDAATTAFNDGFLEKHSSNLDNGQSALSTVLESSAETLYAIESQV